MQQARCICIVSGAVELSSIACGQYCGLRQAGLIRANEMLAKIVQRFLKKFRVKGDLFPNGDRRCVMIDAECQQLHNGDYRFDVSNKGVAMGFLAFLVIGGLTGVFALVFYPGKRQSKPRAKKFLIAVLVGGTAALASSYIGQFAGLFQSGQMLEWLSAIVAACLAGYLYAAASR